MVEGLELEVKEHRAENISKQHGHLTKIHRQNVDRYMHFYHFDKEFAHQVEGLLEELGFGLSEENSRAFEAGMATQL